MTSPHGNQGATPSCIDSGMDVEGLVSGCPSDVLVTDADVWRKHGQETAVEQENVRMP